MRRYLLAVAAILTSGIFASPIFAGADSGLIEYIARDYPVEEFSKLTVSVPADVVYESGKPFLSVEGPEKAVSALDITCTGGKLVINTKKKLRNIKKLDIIASSKCLEAVELNGAVEFECERGFETGTLTAKANGASDMEMNRIVADNICVTLNGAGDVELSNIKCNGQLAVKVNGAGSAEITGISYYADFAINGAGEIDAKELNCSKVSTSVNGVGSIKTH